MPSRLLADDRDGIPNVLVEAMAAGTPVIASAVSGIPELVEHEVNGLLVAPEDPEALADALLRLHGDPELSPSGSRAARRETVARALRRPAAGEPARRAVPGGDPRMTSAVARRPRPVLCVTEHEHRSRAVADDVRAGRFTVAGETRELGTDPDWLGAELPADEEWRIEWVKFAWGLDLAHAPRRPATRLPARLGGADRVVDRARCRPDADAAEVTARRILNWIYAWQRLRRRRRRTHDGAAAREPRRAGRATSARNLTPERNHRTLELYALFVAALALPELDRDGAARPRRRRARPQPARPTSAPTASTARPRRTTT